MPQHRRSPPAKKRRAVKKAYKRKAKRSTKPTTQFARALIPDRTYVKLVYEERVVPTAESGAAHNYRWRGNSIYDPYYSVLGIQPTGYDQWAELYHTYCVLGSSFSIVSLDNSSTTGACQYELGVVPSNTETEVSDTADPDWIASLPYSKFHLVAAHANGPSKIKARYMATSKIEGKDKLAIEGDPGYSANFGSNPSQVWYWNSSLQSIDHSSSIANVYWYVRIVYYCVLFDRKIVPPST